MNNVKAIDVGKFFYDKNNKLTSKQIQKLTYYAYAWYMIKYKNQKLFEEKPQAWIHGPVFASLFASTKSGKFFSYEDYSFDKPTTEFLNIIYKIYGKFTGNQLEKMTHIEDPWINARKGLEPDEPSQEELRDEDIIKYYGK